MGIPKFFRYISERYPATSQLIAENKIPEFDNLYLDFNGIIHNCSHPNDEDAHFRLSEEEIFTAIFSYVDMLFAKIQPKKLFFMAVDGVAPRAKMNQQRSRRFRTVKEAKEVREKALANGEKLPEEKAFDSNCITPGTPFMARLSDQLRYFINKKITEDSAWRGIEVILSGHEVPGEGEHKIMEYIRLSKAQPEYNPNVRHCLYGLDADLIMLGLLSHDPHFCLLREEVKFGPARKKANHSSEAAKFYLLHLSLMREYLNLEFHDIHAKLTFDYSLERVIDDFILLAVFVGNDFLPHLPDLHIHENGLEKLFEVYKKVLPSLDGYLNEGGAICTPRLQVILDEMKAWERDVFEKEYADSNWYKGKQSQHIRKIDESRKHAPDVLSQPQKIILDEVKSFILENRKAAQASRLTMPNTLPARDRKFITKLAEDLNLIISWDEYDDEDQNLVVLEVPTPEADEDTEGKENDGLDVESNEAVDRVLKKYEKLRVAKEDEEGDFDTRHEQVIQEKMNNWKREYYQEKLEISFDDPKRMGALIFRYVEGLQWVMHYYYSGVASWGWFYNYHYAPRISDLTNVDKMSFHFELGRPFKPYEQLMGVLPEASSEHIPLAYRDLMSDPNSPILDFYPQEFTQDMNGKKQEWEAVVKIPFIDEARLLKAMSSREHRLTKEERQRNSFANSLIFTYSDSEPTLYPSSLPGFFPALPRCTCKMEPFNLPTLDGLHLIPGLCDGVALGVDALAGFPSLQTLPYVGMLGYHGVNVHGSESKNKSMVIHITNPFEDQKTETIAQDTIGKRTFIGWPFLREGMVVAVSDRLFKYEKVSFGDGTQKRVLSNPHTQSLGLWASKAEKIEHQYSKRLGVVSGPVEVLLHVRPLKGLIRHDNGAFVKEYEGPDKETEQAIQMAVPEVVSEDPRFIEKDPPPLHEEFPKGCNVFFLGEHAYGAAAQITNSEENTLTAILAFSPDEVADNQKFKDIVNNKTSSRYLPAYAVAQQLNMSGYSLSKITSSLMVLNAEHQKINLGLSLKFEAKSLKVIGYSRKDGRAWEFSDQAISLIREYKQQYPEVFAQLSSSGDSLLAATDIWPGKDADMKLKEVRTWLTTKGVRDLEPVSLFCDQLDKETVSKIFSLEDELVSKQDAAGRKKAMVKGIPRQAVLKPSHALYRLNNQSFALGDRVVMVQDSGSIPLGIKGVVVGLSAKSMDVVWDVPFMSGNTLGNRCPQYRGSVVDFNSCLNLTKPQSVVSTNPNTPAAPIPQRSSFKPRIGPHPVVSPNSGQPPAAGFRGSSSHPSQASAPKGSFAPVRIMSNPQRGRGGPANGHAWTNGRNTVQGNDTSARPAEQSVPSANANVATGNLNHLPPKVNVPGHSHGPPPHRGGQPPFTNGGPPFRGVPRGRGGFGDRGRGFVPRGSRGRGRGTQ